MATISLRTRAYLYLSRHTQWLPRRLEGLHRAIWLGLLDADHLNQITADLYTTSSFGDAQANTTKGLWFWETAAVEKAFTGCRKVLVTSAGGGREAIALHQLGFQVTAFDSSPALTDACRRNAETAGAAITILDAPPDHLPEGLAQQDAVFVGRGSYHHIPSRERRVGLLRECRGLLAKGAPIILSDFFTRSSEASSLRKIQQIANGVRTLRGASERVELGDWLSGCLQHAFDEEEIEAEMRAGGFSMEYYEVSPFGAGSRLAHSVGRASGKP